MNNIDLSEMRRDEKMKKVLEIAKLMMAAEITGLRAKFGMNYIDYHEIASISARNAVILIDTVDEVVE